ncbi:MAG TPA: DivIVA domain-containing protein [Firmicutes bacterium]|nr:DivIVA domain-containing protein [Candidatus Fermentithermobacillaceae bacterium]
MAPRITPLDIHNKEFSRSFRGYNEDEVDEFLDLVVAEFERLIRENEELQSTIAGLESRIEHYKGLEETLKNAIVLAQKAADEIKEAAAREAEAIKRQAEIRAAKIQAEASEALRKSQEGIEIQKQRLLKFRAEMKAFLESTLELLDENVNRIIAGLEDDREVKSM